MKSKVRAGMIMASALVVLVTASTFANVNPMNGNFYIGFTDLVFGVGLKPKVERIYNSKTPFKGMFGWGWGTEYEARLEESVAGSVIIVQYGGGAEFEYWPADVDVQPIQRAIEGMIEVQRARLNTPAQVTAYRDSLTRNSTFRRDQWQRLVKSGSIQQPRVAVGARLSGIGSADEQLTRTENGYVRTLPGGKKETFDVAGRLVRLEDASGNSITFTYDGAGRLQELHANQQVGIKLAYNARGLVATALGSDGKRAEYRYDENDNLVYAKDAAGNAHTYQYDDRHNLTGIGYPDDTKMTISYNRSFHDHVASVVDREGKRTDYTYEADPKRPGWLRVVERVTWEDEDEEPEETAYEYTTRFKLSGQEWVERIVQETSSTRTETRYNECCALPLRILRSSRLSDGSLGVPRETRFEYNDRGLLIEKETFTQLVRLTYVDRINKISTVFARYEDGDTMTTAFEYNATGNLIRARNRKSSVELHYNDKDKISRMIMPDGELSFVYNEMGKPVQITDPAIGTLRVTYASDGEIEKVDAGDTGNKLSLTVTQRFQNLLSLTKPADMSVPCQDTKSCPRRSRPERSDQALGEMPQSAYMGAANRSELVSF